MPYSAYICNSPYMACFCIFGIFIAYLVFCCLFCIFGIFCIYSIFGQESASFGRGVRQATHARPGGLRVFFTASERAARPASDNIQTNKPLSAPALARPADLRLHDSCSPKVPNPGKNSAGHVRSPPHDAQRDACLRMLVGSLVPSR